MSALEEIKARAEKATAGPWVPDTGVRGDCVVWGPNGRFLMNLQSEVHWMEYPGEKRQVSFDVDARDAEFIAHARTDVPKLVAALEAALTTADELIDENQDAATLQSWGLMVAARKIRSAITEALA